MFSIPMIRAHRLPLINVNGLNALNMINKVSVKTMALPHPTTGTSVRGNAAIKV